MMNSKTSIDDEKPKKIPIYPPEIVRAALYWIVAFTSFVITTLYTIQPLIILAGLWVATTSAQLGEQLYKKNIWKEVLYWRALGNKIEEEQLS